MAAQDSPKAFIGKKLTRFRTLTITMTHNGRVTYYHPILETKLVTHDGFVFSLMTKFVENPSQHLSKQDCELKAFYRLAKRLKKRFPPPADLLMVQVGQQVEEGDPVCVLEAMKMENELHARQGGSVRAVYVKPGDDVEKGQVLIEIE